MSVGVAVLRTTPFLHKIAADVAVWGAVPVVAYLFRFDGVIPSAFLPGLAWFIGIGLVFKAIAVVAFGLHTQSWKHASFRDTSVIVRAVATVGAAEFALGLTLHALMPLPRSVLPLSVVLGAIALFAMRAVRRGWYAYREHRSGGGTAASARRALIVGAGDAGHLVVREMQRRPGADVVPVAVVDDDRGKHGLQVDGVPVLGDLERVPALARELEIDEVIVAIASADGALMRRVRALARVDGKALPVRVIPGVYELLSGAVRVSRLREVQIEDLLRRAPVPVDLGPVRDYVDGRTVLVTGAGGSIGSEIVRQLAGCSPARVVLLGRGENSVVELERELERLELAMERVSVITDVRDAASLEAAFRRFEPQVVFHAAAHKHLPLMEANPEQAVLNNVGGTRAVLELALAFGVERLVNISTDKAVRPSSVLGASKRMAEYLVRDAARRAQSGQAFVSVRFGNVLGSRGSVLPVFREQIRRGGPVTVTDPAMTRYFMTIPEACQLVLQAGALASNGSTYLLDMGQPVRIVTLAEDLIRLSGLRPYDDVEIVFTGARPGEKLHEELLIEAEHAEPTRHPHVRVAATAPGEADLDALPALTDALIGAATSGEADGVRRLLFEAVRPELGRP